MMDEKHFNSPAPAGGDAAAPDTDTQAAENTSAASTVVSAAPAGGDAPAAGSDMKSEETTSVNGTAVSEDSAEASVEDSSAAPAENGEDEDDQWAAYEREQAEIEESRRKPGKYRWTLRPDDMREAMLTLEKAKGRYTMYKIASYVMILFALLPTLDFIVSRSLFSMIAALAALSLGIWIKGITSRAGRGAVRQMNPRGIKFSAEVKKHGLQVSDTVNKASLLPYSFFKAAYETGDYLSLVTAKNTALHIRRDPDSASYRQIRDKMRQELGEHFIEKDISKIR